MLKYHNAMGQLKDSVSEAIAPLLKKENIEAGKFREIKRFDNWMLKMKNIYYGDTERMCNAYQLVE